MEVRKYVENGPASSDDNMRRLISYDRTSSVITNELDRVWESVRKVSYSRFNPWAKIESF